MAQYSIVPEWDPFDKKSWRVLEAATVEQLEKWANDPECQQRHNAAAELTQRKERLRLAPAAKKEELQNNPFDTRTDVSADAKHIVKHLWIIFVLLPVVLGTLYAILRANS